MGVLSTDAAARKVLADDASVAGIVGTRIYSMDSVPATREIPFITYGIIYEEHEHDLGGPSGGCMYDIDITLYCTSHSQAVTLKEYCRLALDGYTGTLTIGADSTTIELSQLKSARHDRTTIDNKRGTTVHIVLMQFQIFNKTAT